MTHQKALKQHQRFMEGNLQMALDQLQESSVVDLDEERKAQMVSNLLVVLCSERTTPVVNAGTLYS